MDLKMSRVVDRWRFTDNASQVLHMSVLDK